MFEQTVQGEHATEIEPLDGKHRKTNNKGRKHTATRFKIVCEWVIDAWNDIPTDMVVKSFSKCGISNSMDGMEDDELYNDL